MCTVHWSYHRFIGKEDEWKDRMENSTFPSFMIDGNIDVAAKEYGSLIKGVSACRCSRCVNYNIRLWNKDFFFRKKCWGVGLTIICVSNSPYTTIWRYSWRPEFTGIKNQSIHCSQMVPCQCFTIWYLLFNIEVALIYVAYYCCRCLWFILTKHNVCIFQPLLGPSVAFHTGNDAR